MAEAAFEAGDPTIDFQSPAFTSYVDQRVDSGLPLVFLVKLSDYREDLVCSLLTLYSGNHGDRMNPSRRPRLVLRWSSRAKINSIFLRTVLEYGRKYEIGPLNTAGASQIVASFYSEKDTLTPTFEIRPRSASSVDPWTGIPRPLPGAWEKLMPGLSLVSS